ncbi:MAG: hypothetical protein COT73_01305 [Bdellovibrio sp. CG10_big_fil_rev_8_21_14_0_10_47_8]|nr:MAG: hypothetical protein COT73_01305 [Bdellovibrio sp. CG10_big_fil_rev_8_21_14_0_10_47_8]
MSFLRQTNRSLIKSLRKVKGWPSLVTHRLHEKFPEMLGHEVQGIPVQLYRHDQNFHTVLSFNHFVEFFSGIPKLDLRVQVEAFSHKGRSLGRNEIVLQRQGALQVDLSGLFPDLDHFGLFSVEMKVRPKFIPELSYLGTLHPHFMTVFLPQDKLSSPQMIHSHKLRQGHLLMPRLHRRPSSLLEPIGDLQNLEFYFLNSSASLINAQLNIFDSGSGQQLGARKMKIPGYGVQQIRLAEKDLADHAKDTMYRFEYLFDRSVDHKKPILFRQFKNQIWSCNHT